jgi:hypothetical protein
VAGGVVVAFVVKVLVRVWSNVEKMYLLKMIECMTNSARTVTGNFVPSRNSLRRISYPLQ